jgi:prophage antirepressor-like protein
MESNAKQAGGSLKQRSPGMQARASGNEFNFQEENVMANSITATSDVIPFSFEKREVRTLLIDDQPWFAAKDIVHALGYAALSAPAKLVEHVPTQWKGVNPIHTRGGTQKLLMLSEQGLYFFLGRSDKPKALPFQMWLAGEVLPTIRKTGTYTDSSNKMAVLVDDVIGISGTNLINGVIGQKVAILPTGVQRQAKHKLHAILHTRFNVPRTELIPAEKLDIACEYLAAYALEGEWLGRAQDVSPPRQSLQRVMLYWDHEGVERRKEIPTGAYVMTKEEFLRALLVDGDMLITTDEMFEFATLAMATLRGRSQYATQQLQELRRKATAA